MSSFYWAVVRDFGNFFKLSAAVIAALVFDVCADGDGERRKLTPLGKRVSGRGERYQRYQEVVAMSSLCSWIPPLSQTTDCLLSCTDRDECNKNEAGGEFL